MAYEFDTKLDLQTIMESPNVAELLSEEDCKYVGRAALEGYQEDLDSRKEGGWEKRTDEAMKLALQISEGKNFPWQGCSNVKFPLITVASMYYAARAYSTLVDRTDLVTCGVYGPDPDGQKTARAQRIGEHMTWQNIRQDKCWEEEHDKAFLVQPIAGDAFIKRVFDPVCGHLVTKLITPKNFVVNYWTRDLESSPRYTEVYDLYDRDIRERELDGRFCTPDKPITQTEPEEDALTQTQDERTGLKPPPLSIYTPYETGEQYCWWDLDNDGYPEPYIITFDIGTGFVRRMVARFLPSGVKRRGGEVQRIEPIEVYTRLPFIPSPDGGFYSLGFGHLLGPINESVNTAINQLFDAGTMSTLGGGFFGRGVKNRAGPFTMRPFEFYPLDGTGDDIRKSVMSLPVKEPSQVLLQLAMFLIGYGERIASANDMQVGENPGQNTPAETARTMNENGQRVYSAIYKRTWRAMGEEYCQQYNLNQLHLAHTEDYINITSGKGAMIRRDDYVGPALEIIPSADPYVISDAQRVQQATMLVQAAGSLPGFNRYEVQSRWLCALKVPARDKVMPPPMQQGPNGQMVPAQDFPPPPPPPQTITAQANLLKAQTGQAKQQFDAQQAHAQLMMDIRESIAKINNLNAQAELYLAQTKETEAEPAIKLIYAEIESENSRKDRLVQMAQIISDHMIAREANASGATGSNGAGMVPVAQPPTNAGVLGALGGASGGGQGGLGGGPVPIQ